MSNDSNYNPVNPLGVFPNWIFCPKIVPLVYDDSLSYYEFLNKLMVKLNEVITFANQINANVDYLRVIVERLQTLIDGFDARISQNEEDISALQAATDALNTSIEGINSMLETMQGDIDANSAAIEDLAESVETEIATAIVPLTNTVNALTNTVSSNTTRIETLENAAFDPTSFVIPPAPFNFVMSMLNGNSNGIRIVVDGTGATSDSIQWVDGGQYDPTNIPQKQKFTQKFKIPRFYSSGNQAHLVIPSVFPIKYGANVDFSLYFYANRWTGGTSVNTGIVKVGTISFSTLLAEGGYSISGTPSSGSACFNEMELFPNLTTGCYDLYIYNGRNGHYSWINDYMMSSIMITTTDFGNTSQLTGIQKYFNELNSHAIQLTSAIDGKISSATAEITHDYQNADNTVLSTALSADFLAPTTPLFTAATGVTVSSNNTRFSSWNNGVDREGRKIMFELIVSIADITPDTTITIGSYSGVVTKTHSLNFQILAPSNGGYCSIASDGTIAARFYGTSFPSSTTVRIYGYVWEPYNSYS